MSPDTGMKFVLVAGTMSFGNEWFQTKKVNWRIPVATVLAGAATAGIGRVSPGGAASLGVMAIIVASTTSLNGKSPIEELLTVVNHPKTKTTVTVTRKKG